MGQNSYTKVICLKSPLQYKLPVLIASIRAMCLDAVACIFKYRYVHVFEYYV